jgi:hypothetical protein
MTVTTRENLPPIFKSILSVEDSRKDIINAINEQLEPLNSPKLVNDSISSKNYSKNVNRTGTSSNYMLDVKTLGLRDIQYEIPECFSQWIPVMQIARSSRGDGTLNIPKGTATTITMYNNEVETSFFTEEDTKLDNNNIPLCYWGNNINNSTSSGNVVNKAPNSPLFRHYSKASSKAGSLLPAPGTTNGGSTMYYQITFPYNCYVYITANTQVHWNNIESNGTHGAFIMITDGSNIIANRSSHDDGNGNNTLDKNREWSVVNWHGYVKKGWKLYYAEQDAGWVVVPGNYGMPGFCCVIFKADNNSVNAINNNSTKILSLNRCTIDYDHDSDIIVSASNTDANNIIVQTESKLTKGLSEQATIPNTPLFNKYSISGSKPGVLFPSVGTLSKGLWATLNIPYDCYIDFTLFAGSCTLYESVSVYAFMICDRNGNILVVKTSYDDGNGNNKASANRLWGNIYYTGIVKAGYKVYFATIPIATSAAITNGLSLNLFKLPQINLEPEYMCLSSASNSINALIYDSVRNSYTETSADPTTTLPKMILYTIDSFGWNYSLYKYAVKNVSYDGVAVVSLHNSTANAAWRAHSYYLHTDKNNNLKSYKYSAAGPIDNNSSTIDKFAINKDDKIYIFIHAEDVGYQDLWHGKITVTTFPNDYTLED